MRENASSMYGRLILRASLYTLLLFIGLLFLLPLFVMIVTSLKSMEEVRTGQMLALPRDWTLEPWVRAWGTACIGLTCKGIGGYFWNSIRMVVPAVVVSTAFGAFNGYVLTKWRFRGHRWVFGLILFACFIPYQIVLLPMSAVLGFFGISNSVGGLVFVHVVYGLASPRCFFETTTRPFQMNC